VKGDRVGEKGRGWREGGEEKFLKVGTYAHRRRVGDMIGRPLSNELQKHKHSGSRRS